jgi:transcription-repair coupling factor (superfamily II helicase)
MKESNIILDELKKDELVIHDVHGIGIFNGIEHTKVLGNYKDYVSIFYQNQDKLLLPIENLESINRYIADSSKAPNLTLINLVKVVLQN